MRTFLRRVIVTCACSVVLVSCASDFELGGLPPLPAPTIDEAAYRLGPGDHLSVTVFEAPSLSGPDLQVAADGSLALPLVGATKAAGLTVGELTQSVRERLVQGNYLRDPKVALQVITYRPVYVLGEVKTPGEYPYTPGMTITNAVARAGGFTFRAFENGFTVTRDGSKYHAGDAAKLQPDDVVKISGRIF